MSAGIFNSQVWCPRSFASIVHRTKRKFQALAIDQIVRAARNIMLAVLAQNER